MHAAPARHTQVSHKRNEGLITAAPARQFKKNKKHLYRNTAGQLNNMI